MKHSHLPSPTQSQSAPPLDRAAALLGDFSDQAGDRRHVVGRRGRAFDEFAELLAFFRRVGWDPGAVGWLAVEEIGYEYLVLVGAVIGIGEDIRTLGVSVLVRRFEGALFGSES